MHNVFRLATFNVPALLDLAGRLRLRPCTCDLSQRPRQGSFNWAITICFEDGVEWIFRSPRNSRGDLDMETLGTVLASEAATLKYIKQNSSIPVPEVFYYSSTNLNNIGVPFILMSKAQGSEIKTSLWHAPSVSKVPILDKDPPRILTLAEKEKIMNQLGGIVSQLSRLQFDKIGSVFEEGERYHVNTCLSPALYWHGRHQFKDEGVDHGPFSHGSEYYESLVLSFLIHVECLPMGHHMFSAPVPTPDEYDNYDDYLAAGDRWNEFVKVGTKIDSGKNRLDYIIVGELLLGMIPWLARECDSSSGVDTRFPLHHPDLNVGNIFIDDDCNITCIIDWAYASTVPLSTLLVTPSMPHPRDKPDPTMDIAFKTGFEEDQRSFTKAEGTETGRYDSIWGSCKDIWLFTRLVRQDALQDIHYFTELYHSRQGRGETNISLLIKKFHTQDKFPALGANLAKGDRAASKIQKEENEYFTVAGTDKFAVARKLTVVSSIKEDGFLADQRLWKWLAKAVTLENPRNPICS